MPKILNILTYPDDRLRLKASPVDPSLLSSPKIKELLSDMHETMLRKDGAGLAAPQIGESLRLVVISHDGKSYLMVNPEITKRSWSKETEEEGCLSVLDAKGEIIYDKVERHKKVNVVYLDETGKKCKLAAEKMLARIIQHEIDHLDGILFIDRIKKKRAL